MNRLKYRILTTLLGELCVKSGSCRMCYANFDSACNSKPQAKYACPHGYIYEQAKKVWKVSDAVNPLEDLDA